MFSIVFLPATLIASIWGMNVGLPAAVTGDSSTTIFWIIIAAMVAVARRHDRLLPASRLALKDLLVRVWTRIWAPWRLEYVKDASKDSAEECIFCAKPDEGDDEAALIVHRGDAAS